MLRQRLPGVDAAWLAVERPESLMMVTGFLRLGAPLPPEVLGRLVSERLLAVYPRFTQRVIQPRLGRPFWETDPGFDLGHHVRHVQVEGGEAGLRRHLDRLAGTQLDFERPPWQIHLLEADGEPPLLCFRLHHCLGDGLALLAVLLSVCDGEPTLPVATGAVPSAEPGWAAAARRGWRYTAAVAKLALLPFAPRGVLRGRLGPEVRTAWSQPLDLEKLKRAATERGATVNDLLTAAVAGALRSYLGKDGQASPELRAVIPVNLRSPENAAELGNRFGLVMARLPVGQADGEARLAAAKSEMDQLKAAPEAAAVLWILQLLGFTTTTVTRLVYRFFGSKATLVLTNVPGPRRVLHLDGVPIDDIMAWVPQSGGLGVGISILSYAGAVRVGVIADVLLVPDPEAIVAALEEEAAALT